MVLNPYRYFECNKGRKQMRLLLLLMRIIRSHSASNIGYVSDNIFISCIWYIWFRIENMCNIADMWLVNELATRDRMNPSSWIDYYDFTSTPFATNASLCETVQWSFSVTIMNGSDAKDLHQYLSQNVNSLNMIKN